MAASTDPTVLVRESSCYGCIPTGMHAEVAINLLNRLSGLNLTPQQLVDAAKCYDCIPTGMQDEVKTMMLQSLLIGLEQESLACDADARAFIVVANITDQTQINAICQLVSDLKNYPSSGTKYWYRDEIVYPMVGGVDTSHAVNLKNPSSNTLSYVGAGLTHDARGITGNGTAYIDTGYPLAAAQTNSVRGMVYIDSRPAPGAHRAYFGSIGTGAGPPYFYLTYRTGEGICRFGVNGSSGVASPTLDAVGANFIQRKTDAANIQISNASNIWSSVANASLSQANRNVFLLALNDGTPPPIFISTATISGFSLGSPLTTDAELAEYRSIWDRYEAALGRGH